MYSSEDLAHFQQVMSKVSLFKPCHDEKCMK